MKFIITENKLERVALKFINNELNLDQFEIVEHPDYPNSILFKKDGRVVMEQDKDSKYFWFDDYEIWGYFRDLFGFDNDQIRIIFKHWLEETLKLEDYTPNHVWLREIHLLDETLKLEDYTPNKKVLVLQRKLEETIKLKPHHPL